MLFAILIIEESKYCEDFEHSIKSWICDNVSVDGDVKSKRSLSYQWKV